MQRRMSSYKKLCKLIIIVLSFHINQYVCIQGDSTDGQGWKCKDTSTEAEGKKSKREGNRFTKRQKRKNT